MKFKSPGKSWITPCLVVTIVVITLPVVPMFINIVGLLILSIIALASCKIIHLYYANLPAPKVRNII